MGNHPSRLLRWIDYAIHGRHTKIATPNSRDGFLSYADRRLAGRPVNLRAMDTWFFAFVNLDLDFLRSWSISRMASASVFRFFSRFTASTSSTVFSARMTRRPGLAPRFTGSLNAGTYSSA